jgi:hypothetical protein
MAPNQPAPYGQQQPAYGAQPNYGAPQPAYGDTRGAAPLPGQPQGAGFEGPGQDGERGLGATLVGGAGGGFLAHEVGGGVLGTIAGTVVGAIGANFAEHKYKEHKQHGHNHDHHHHGHNH